VDDNGNWPNYTDVDGGGIMTSAIAIEGLWKSFSGDPVRAESSPQKQAALFHVSLEIRSHEIMGVLGAANAGKTTLLNILAGQLEPDAGRIVINGREAGTYPPLLREQVAFEPQPLTLANPALAGKSLIVLDEPHLHQPSLSLPEISSALRDFVRTPGRSAIVATRDPVLAQRLCDRVTLMNTGHILSVIPVRYLAEAYQNHELYEFQVHGQFDPAWYDWMDDIEVIPCGGDSLFYCPVVDQANLFGVIARFRDLGQTLLAIRRLNTKFEEPDRAQ
jgi:ABC-type multidrug transport system ATPase subunit